MPNRSFYVEDANGTVYLAEQVDGFHAVLCPVSIWCHNPDLFDEEPDCTCEPVYQLTLHAHEGGETDAEDDDIVSAATRANPPRQ